MAGKGDRPRKVDRSKFENNWDKIFGGRMTVSEPNATRIKDFFEHEDSVDTDNVWTPKAMSQVQIDRKLREWGIMYQLLMNLHGYEDPLREAATVLKQIKV